MLPRMKKGQMLRRAVKVVFTTDRKRKRFFSFLSKQGVCMKQTTSISARCWERRWESDSGKTLCVITLAQTSAWGPQVIRVGVVDSNGSSSQSPPDRHHEDDGKPQQLSHLPPLPFLSNDRQAHTFQRMSQDSRRIIFRQPQRGSVFTTCLASSSSCSTGMFIVK